MTGGEKTLDFTDDEKIGRSLCGRCRRKEAPAVHFDVSSGRFLCDGCYRAVKLEQRRLQEALASGRKLALSFQRSVLPVRRGKRG